MDEITGTEETVTPEQIKEYREKAKQFDAQTKQLDDTRKRLESQRRRGQETGPTQVEFNRLHTSVASIMQALASIDSVPDTVKTQMYTAKAVGDAEAAKAQVQSAWLQELEDALEENDIDWEDPKLSKANEMWKSGNFMGAVKEVYRSTKASATTVADDTKKSSDDIAKMVQEQVNATLKASGIRTVDVKEGSVSTTPGRRGVKLQEFTSLNPAKVSAKELAKQHEEMLNKFYGG